tara:strand:+ start:141 stop:1340 length:1200 start_codon:yes stop_codon:yes gene_type:complete
MSDIKTKAIFYAYSNNALDHLAPYAVLCKERKMSCTVIYGEDFVKQKVRPRNNIIQIFKNYNISTYNITSIGKKGIIQSIFSYIWCLANIIENYQFIPNFFKSKIKGLAFRIFQILDGELIGKNAAIKLLENKEKVIVFTDSWVIKKKFQNGFLSYVKGKASIISTNHTPWHFHRSQPIQPSSFSEDVALVSNKWEADAKNYIKNKEIVGTLRYSKKWLAILDEYSLENISNTDSKKNVLVLTHTEFHTKDWIRMLELLRDLQQKEDINLKILPHIRGMLNMEPPKGLEKVWDKTTTLDVAVKNSDIVIFWESSGIFEAVVRNKKIFYLSFLSKLDGEYIWQKDAPTNIIIKNEIELFNEIIKYEKKDLPNNKCFQKIIWPEGDPWFNVSNFLDKYLTK